jgi:hypothetical protein
MKRFAFLLFVISLSSACGRCDAEKQAPTSASVAVSAAPPASVSSEAVTPSGDVGVEPVYPKTNDPPDPLAEKLCAALNDVPVKRRAECCSHPPGFSLVSECTRSLSYALRNKAVTIDVAAVDACIAAMKAVHEGCDWVGPAHVTLPSACDGIVRGSVEEGKRCRSSLECQDGYRCLGVGPTDTGVCRKPLPNGYPCALAVDSLAALTRQDNIDKQHPECVGNCAFRRCQDFVALHGACKTSAQCGAGKACIGGSCEEGSLPGEGKPCAKGSCAMGLRCEKGTCASRKSAGTTCTTDAECIGGCIRGDGGKEGTCGTKCGFR